MIGPRALLCTLLATLAGCQAFSRHHTPASTERWRGHLNVAGDHLRFTPCGEQRRFALQVPTELIGKAQALAHGRDALFLDFRGTARPGDGGDGQLTLTRLLRLEPDAGACDDPAFARRVVVARGSEPDWRIEVTPRGLLLEAAGQPPLALPFLEEQLPGGRLNFSSEANGRHLELWVAPQTCELPARSALSGMTATLTLDGQTLHGCAYPGAADD